MNRPQEKLNMKLYESQNSYVKEPQLISMKKIKVIKNSQRMIQEGQMIQSQLINKLRPPKSAKKYQSIIQSNVIQNLISCSQIQTASKLIQDNDEIAILQDQLGANIRFKFICHETSVSRNNLVQKINGMTDLLIIVQAKQNNEKLGRFTIYLSVPFQNVAMDQYVVDQNAFILQNDYCFLIKQINNKDRNIGFSPNSILILGKQNQQLYYSPRVQKQDLILKDSHSFSVKQCTSCLGQSFMIPEALDQQDGQNILAGVPAFKIDQIEIFQVIKN
ncbi:UNKNOWN [Stylonychia lemnae]|uniref:TLDc domain-containing protein n=1 Tax=Stylonychia lemnae TaxID=5949 RepID=A0A078AGC4_STYLE|nr:UNKNOWN [Stylonychia lemnae]|eukprot:CDW79888.1 UNKNOWN [Stylonychia lemnae]